MKNAPGHSYAPFCTTGGKKNAKVNPHGAPRGVKSSKSDPQMTLKGAPGGAFSLPGPKKVYPHKTTAFTV